MAVKPLFMQLTPYLWHAWWRKQSQRGVWHGANTAMVTFMAILGLVAVLACSLFSAMSLKDGATDRGMIMLEFCLNSVLMGWLAVPIMVGSTTAEGRGLQPVRMGQFPMNLNQLMTLGFMGHMVQPVYWILGLSSLLVFIPLTMAPEPVSALIAGGLFILFSGLLAWSVELFGGALFSSRHGREMMMLGVLVLMVPMLFLINADYTFENDELTVTVLDHSRLLLNMDGTDGLLSDLRLFSPSIMVSSAARGFNELRGISILALLSVLGFLLARFSLKRVMLHPPSSLRGRKGSAKGIHGLSFLSPLIGPLVVKEIRYLTRTLDHLMGVCMGLIGFAWIMVKPEHLIYVLPLGAMNIVLNEAAIPLNNFGLDASGAERYRLLPMSGRQVLWTKNLAFFALALLHVTPVLLAGLLKGAWLLTLTTALATTAVCLLTAAGGNFASIKSPAPRAFFNFDSKEQTGGGLALFLAALVWAIPVILYFSLAWWSMVAVVLAMAVLLVVSWLVYGKMLTSAGENFESAGESMRGKLSKE